MIKKFSLLIAMAGLTGCQQLFPGTPAKPGVQDPHAICRATPGTLVRDVLFPIEGRLTDDTTVFTGETNGEDGVTENVELCKRDLMGAMTGCQTASGTGVLSDGTVIEFMPTTINVKLASSNGWARATFTINYTCH